MKMKNVKRILALVLTVVIIWGNVDCVQAISFEDKVGTITPIPTNDVHTYEFGESWTTYSIGFRYVSSKTKLNLKMPSNNGRDLIQGRIYFVPLKGGTSITLGYGNYAMEDYAVDLSSIPAGSYMIKIGGVTVGSSSRAKVTCSIE